MHNLQPRILRTQTGYQLGKLQARGLPPRTSQALLLAADDYSVTCAARAMNCTPKNVGALLSRLREKTGTATKTGLITRAFERGWLRFAATLTANRR